jgi:hypothetical protein
MELQHCVAVIDTLLEKAEPKRMPLTHALNARERVEQGEESAHGAPLTLRKRAYSTNMTCDGKLREGSQRCVRSWRRSSNGNGNAELDCSVERTTHHQEGVPPWNRRNAPN